MTAASTWRRAGVAVGRRLPTPSRHTVGGLSNESAAVQAMRRRIVSGVVLAGTGLLALSLSARPGSKRFYATTAALAATWAAGGVASGPLHRGWTQEGGDKSRRPVLTPIAAGVTSFALFYGFAHVARRVPALDRAIARALSFAEEGDHPLVMATTLANGAGEEIFFRGAVYAAFGDNHPVAASTAVYTLVTTSTRNPAMVVAAGVMGTVFAMQRRASGGIQAPTITHLVWSALMIRYLPRPRSAAQDRKLRRPSPARSLARET